jgi:hypothetical protein
VGVGVCSQCELSAIVVGSAADAPHHWAVDERAASGVSILSLHVAGGDAQGGSGLQLHRSVCNWWRACDR